MPTYTYETPYGDLDIDAKDQAESEAKLMESLRVLEYSQKVDASAQGKGRKTESTWEYVKDAVAGQWADLTGKINAGRAPGMAGMVPGMSPDSDRQSATQYASRAADTMNYEGLSPADVIQSTVGEAAKSATHPASYLGPGGPLLKVATALGAGAGGEVAATVARHAGAEEGGLVEFGSRIAGGIGGAAPFAASASVLGNLYKAGKRALNPEHATKVASEEASKQVKAMLKQAMKADPGLKGDIQKAMLEAQEAGMELPVTALIDNPVIQSRLNQLAKTDPEFNGLYYNKVRDAMDQLNNLKSQAFGDVDKAADTVSEFANRTPQQIAEETAAKKAARINDSVLAQARSKTAQAFPAAEREADLVKRLERVSNEDLRVSPIASEQYTTIAAKAAEDGSALSSTSAADLISMIGDDIQQNNPFHRFPSIIDRAKKIIKPQENGEFAPIPYSAARDLQQEINAAKRSASEAADKHHLGKLGERLEEMMYRDMPDHAEALRAANSRFAYDANLRDFALSAIDSKTGILNPEKAAKWIAENRSAVDRVKTVSPELDEVLTLRQSVVDPSLDIAKVLAKQVKAENIVGSIKVEDFFKGRTPDAIAQLLMKDPTWGKEAIKRFSKDPDALKAMRSFMLNHLTSDPSKPFSAYVKTPTAVSNLNRLFGPGYKQTVDKLGGFTEKLQKAMSHESLPRVGAGEGGIVEGATGVPAAQIFSRLRNQIISVPQAIFELASKGLTAKMRGQVEREMKDIMVDPQRFAQLVRLVDNTDDPAKLQTALHRFLGIAKKVGAGAATAGVKAAIPVIATEPGRQDNRLEEWRQ